MELKLLDGDYVKTAVHDLEAVSGPQETAQRIMMRLRARRGGFALLPEYGSRLYTLTGKRPGQWESCARQFVAEALEGENAVLEQLSVREQDGRLMVELELRCAGETLHITTEI